MAVASAKFSARTAIQIEPETRRRLERIARARRAKLSQILREAIDTGLPVLEAEMVDRKMGVLDMVPA